MRTILLLAAAGCAPSVPGADLGFGEPLLSDARLAGCEATYTKHTDGVPYAIARWVYNDAGHRVVADLDPTASGTFSGREITEFRGDLPVRSTAGPGGGVTETWLWFWVDGQRVEERYDYHELDYDLLYQYDWKRTFDWSDERIQRTHWENDRGTPWRWSLDRMSATVDGVKYTWDDWGNLVTREAGDGLLAWDVDDQGRIVEKRSETGSDTATWEWDCP